MSHVPSNLSHLGPEQKRAILAQLMEKRTGEPRRFPLSFAQQRLWFLDHLASQSHFYNESIAERLPYAVDPNVLRRALNEIVRRHDSLRTTFGAVNGQPFQIVQPKLVLPLPIVDLIGFPAAAREAEALRLATEEAQQPFDLSRGPLLRAKLLKMDDEEDILLLTLHHIISDGWSMTVLLRELATLYEAFLQGLPVQLPPLPIQYPDFAVWQREWLTGDVLESQSAYWKEQLRGLTTLQVPMDWPRPPVQTFKGAHCFFNISKHLSASLKDLSEREGVTLFMTLLAAFQILLHRYSGQDDIVIGVPIANRNRAELEPLIGFFVNTLVVRTDLSGNPAFRDLLKRVREVTVAAYAHQDLPFEKLVEELQPVRDLSHNPLVQVTFQLVNVPSCWEVTIDDIDGKAAGPLPVSTQTALFDLRVDLWETLDGLTCMFEYSTDLFEKKTIDRMTSHFKTLLYSITSDPDQLISELQFLSPVERHQLLVEWNKTTRGFPNRCIHELIEEQAERSPTAIAISFEGTHLTYSELNRKANQIAHYLRKHGVGPDTLVALCIDRSLEMIVGILAILKSGGAFIPFDAAYPEERLAFMLEDSEAPILLTQKRLLNRFAGHKAQVVCVDSEADLIARESERNVVSGVRPDNLAYMIYTSGSTGKPKGALLRHLGLSNLSAYQRRTFEINSQSRVLQFATLSFDASVFEIFMTLPAGGTLVLATQLSVLPGPALSRLLQEEHISFVLLPPSALLLMPYAPLPHLKVLTLAGEAFSAELVERWAPGRRFFNLYGPTEATVLSTVAECRSGDRIVSIGRPIDNVRCYVLDGYKQLVPVGVAGELYVGGISVGPGYFDRPELTKEKFVPDPFSAEPGARLYRTGDLVRYLPDGSLQFLGRIDHQVKIRGYRVELGEIETTLNQHTAVRDCLVMAREDTTGDKRLVAYVVPHDGEQIVAIELLQFLRNKLPQYMIPAAVIFLDGFPTTPSGKVDRRLLPAPEEATLQNVRQASEPGTELEISLSRVWQDLLHRKDIGLDANFFDVGGHSLLLVRLHDRLRREVNPELAIVDLFHYPTIRSLAEYLSHKQSSNNISFDRLEDRSEKQRQAISQMRPRGSMFEHRE